ncbi:hypothetical protein PYCCODRAFT_1197481 [Trametes coccinea BRFM310]|uniref:Uncharacterized protein n=1 Tax=Trametes coccinea (strain BRFM310) TaxID=1353009 RepID=A0A1Y2I7F1_TRAC3|nr:hypothetical protein PYCCODRAFT_1197481 [Trametes coccinea BRFM310]
MERTRRVVEWIDARVWGMTGTYTCNSPPFAMNDPRRYDPRLGDEDLAAVLEQSDHGHPGLPHRPQKHVRIPDDPGHDPDAPSDDTGTDKSRARPRKKPPEPWHKRLLALLPFDLSWIPANFTRSKIKPAIRCAFVCFVSAILMVIPRVYNLMGQPCVRCTATYATCSYERPRIAPSPSVDQPKCSSSRRCSATSRPWYMNLRLRFLLPRVPVRSRATHTSYARVRAPSARASHVAPSPPPPPPPLK